MENPSRTFPSGFLWGVSTSAHQVEGNNTNNQWAAWEAAGRIKTGERCGRACNWWEAAEQDFDLAQQMGLNALRLSVEWSRIEPREGEWDHTSLARYRDMLSELRARKIRPIVSLHHFTNPLWLEEQGAFLSSKSIGLFARFARQVVSSLHDLCDLWVTFNEPNVYATLGYLLAEFPPGKRAPVSTIRVLANIARAHAQAYRAIHELQPQAQVGWTDNYIVFKPADPNSALDRWAASLQHHLFNASFARLVEKGSLAFPLNLIAGDLAEVKGACDFVGLNVYNRAHVSFDLRCPALLFGRLFIPEGVPQGDEGIHAPYGEAYPHGITLAAQNAAKLGKPIYILENGVPDAEDRIRPWVIGRAALELHELIQRGFDVRGYFHWSLVDNFEWSEGWRLRFGLYALDLETQQRTPRKSAELYGAIARANGLSANFSYDSGSQYL